MTNKIYTIFLVYIAERSKSSDLDSGQGDLGSNPGEGMCFFWDGELSGSHTVCFHTW